jgi:hypothetical protein
MSYNGSGVFVINTAGQPVVSGTVISSTAFNALTADLASGLSTALTKDGQTTPTNNIKMGSFKITGLGTGTAATDAANVAQVQNGSTSYLTVSGTNTITGALIPSLTSYTAGATYYFVASATNTGPVTINIDGLGAKDIKSNSLAALAAGDIVSGQVVGITYDGTQFQTVNYKPNGTANGIAYFNGSGALSSGSGITYDGTNFALTGGAVIGSPTGGNKGAGTINATALYVNGTAVNAGSNSLVLISSKTASSSSTLEWTGLSGYNKYLLVLENIRPSTDVVSLYLQYGTGSTPTYETTGYSVANQSSTITTGLGYALAGQIGSNFVYGTAPAQGVWGFAYLDNTLCTAYAYPTMAGVLGFHNNAAGGSNIYSTSLNGIATASTTAKTAIRIQFSSGNIASGIASLYGISQ